MIGLWIVLVSIGIVLCLGLAKFINLIVYDFQTRDYQSGIESILNLLLLSGLIIGSFLMLAGI